MSEYIVSLSGDWASKQGEKLTEIVRCRDCKHYRPHEFVLITDIEHVCLFWADGCKVEPNGFCAWGERRDT